jgi:hypothetical protein
MIGSISSQVPPANPHPILGIATDARCSRANTATFPRPSRIAG